mgnify:CR=1 FL=1
MKEELIEILRCPKTNQKLELGESQSSEGEIKSGILQTLDGKNSYPIVDSIPRFVDKSNYADNFGKQWNKFRLTQLDSYSKTSISADRFWKATGLSQNFCKGKVFLDAGCGAGRFAEVVLNAGGTVIAIDFSSAVDAAFLNLKHFKNFHVIQEDIYEIPLKHQSFDVVYSLGVLQHTPNVEAAFRSLPKFVSRSGILCTDFYWRRIRTLMHSKYLVRPLTKRMDQIKLFSFLEKYTHFMLKISIFLSNIPLVGKFLMRLVPVANYSGVYPLSKEQLAEWALLDTFDMLAPQYDTPQAERTIRKWMEEEGLESIEVLQANLLAIRGIKN